MNGGLQLLSEHGDELGVGALLLLLLLRLLHELDKLWQLRESVSLAEEMAENLPASRISQFELVSFEAHRLPINWSTRVTFRL